MIRKAIIALFSLLAVGTVVVWVVTLWWSFSYWHAADGLRIGHGAICVHLWHNVLPEGVMWPEQGWRIHDSGEVTWIPRSYFRSGRLWGVDVPLWLPFVLLSAYPTVAFIRGPVRRWRRRRKGLCVKCGFDLTGNVSGICPECGTKIERP